MKDDQRRSPVRGLAFRAAALLLAAACAVSGAACWLRNPPEPPAEEERSDLPPATPTGRGPFAGWTKPDFVLVLSGQQHGYLLPCGCSSPQYGGLERRYNLIQQLRTERGWEVLPIDLGDIPQKEGPAKLPNVQGLLKYRYSMEALAKMGYLATSFGEYEAVYPLNSAMDEYALNNARPAVLAANLKDRAEKHFPDPTRRSKSYVGSWEPAQTARGTKVGVLGIIGSHDKEKDDDPPSVAEVLKAKVPELAFERADKTIPRALAEMQQEGVAFRALLYQGPFDRAQLLAKFFPDFQVILCLCDSDLAPESATPANSGNTLIVRVGHKGKAVGVVGVWQTGKADRPFELRYQMISLGEDLKTLPEKEKGNDIVALMESYTRELKNENYLARYHQNTHRVQYDAQQLVDAETKKKKYAGQLSEYVGSQACKSCHKHAYKVWEESAHSHAYQTLVDAKRPGNRQFDGECIVCHTVGFGYRTGFQNDSSPAVLKSVGCESCHGPCGLHVKNKDDEDLYPIINPWRAKANETAKDREKRMLSIEAMCQRCHDQDNDVHWTFDKWEKKGIIHMTP